VYNLREDIKLKIGLTSGSTMKLLRLNRSKITKATYELLFNEITQATGTFENNLLRDQNRVLPNIDSALNFYTQERQNGAVSLVSQAAQRAADDVAEAFRRAVNEGQFDLFQGRERIAEMQEFINSEVATRRIQYVRELRDGMVNELTTSIAGFKESSPFSVSVNDFSQFSTKAQESDAIDKLNSMIPTTIDQSRANTLRNIVRRYIGRMP